MAAAYCKIPVAAAQVRSGPSAGARTPTCYFGGGRPALIEKTVPYGPCVEREYTRFGRGRPERTLDSSVGRAGAKWRIQAANRAKVRGRSILCSSLDYASHLRDLGSGWRSEQATVFAAELRWAFIAHAVTCGGSVDVFDQHQATSLVQP